jgi:hypothetical protein
LCLKLIILFNSCLWLWVLDPKMVCKFVFLIKIITIIHVVRAMRRRESLILLWPFRFRLKRSSCSNTFESSIWWKRRHLRNDYSFIHDTSSWIIDTLSLIRILMLLRRIFVGTINCFILDKSCSLACICYCSSFSIWCCISHRSELCSLCCFFYDP